MLTRFILGLTLSTFAATSAVQTGPAVGSKMPDFQAVDQDGKQHSLMSLLGPKGAVLVVYRSADW